MVGGSLRQAAGAALPWISRKQKEPKRPHSLPARHILASARSVYGREHRQRSLHRFPKQEWRPVTGRKWREDRRQPLFFKSTIVPPDPILSCILIRPGLKSCAPAGWILDPSIEGPTRVGRASPTGGRGSAGSLRAGHFHEAIWLEYVLRRRSGLTHTPVPGRRSGIANTGPTVVHRFPRRCLGGLGTPESPTCFRSRLPVRPRSGVV